MSVALSNPAASGGAIDASPTRLLGQFAANLKFEDIPAHVVHQAKRVILDTIGCTIGGYSIAPGKSIVKVVTEMGGKEEATVLPSGQRTSVANAAYSNCELANILDLDDAFMSHGHFANCTVMAPLAAAEPLSSSGKELITAVVAGYEVAARVNLSLSKTGRVVSPPPDIKIEYSPVHGGGFAIFGAAAAVGRLIGLSENQMLHALGMAGFTSPIPGFAKITGTMPMFKYCPFGSIGWESVMACKLAAAGMEGVTTIFDGDRGYWRMVGSDYSDWDVLTGGWVRSGG